MDKNKIVPKEKIADALAKMLKPGENSYNRQNYTRSLRFHPDRTDQEYIEMFKEFKPTNGSIIIMGEPISDVYIELGVIHEYNKAQLKDLRAETYQNGALVVAIDPKVADECAYKVGDRVITSQFHEPEGMIKIEKEVLGQFDGEDIETSLTYLAAVFSKESVKIIIDSNG